MRTTSIKEKPSKAGAASVVLTTQGNTWSNSQSPKAINVNSLLTDINQPKNRFEGALTVLGTQDVGTDNLDDLCDFVPPEVLPNNKSNMLTSPDSPIGVKEGIMVPTLSDNTPPDKQAQPVVRINDNPTPPLSRENFTTSSNNIAPHSVLKNHSSAQADGDDPPTSLTSSSGGHSLRGLEQGNDYTIDRFNKLYIVYDENCQESRFHVEEFVGLFPSWPIIEMSIAPAGNTKDERMTSFVKCFTSLFAKIQYVNNSAAIAPINIYDDDKAICITDRSSLPDNFTKLGKWLMISKGSCVFDRKEKGNGEVYARFRLKSQDMAKEIVNWVSFEFNCLGGSRLSKKMMQAMETETPMMLLFVCNGTDQSSISTDILQNRTSPTKTSTRIV